MLTTYVLRLRGMRDKYNSIDMLAGLNPRVRTFKDATNNTYQE